MDAWGEGFVLGGTVRKQVGFVGQLADGGEEEVFFCGMVEFDEVTVAVDEEKEICYVGGLGDMGRLVVDGVEAAEEHVVHLGHVVGDVD